MSLPPSADELMRSVLVTLEPPPGGLTRLRARRRRPPRRVWPWALAGAAATVAALVLALRMTPPPSPTHAPVDLIAGVDASKLHPRWVGLGLVAPPTEPMTLSPELAGTLAARRVATGDDSVVFYMLDPR